MTTKKINFQPVQENSVSCTSGNNRYKGKFFLVRDKDGFVTDIKILCVRFENLAVCNFFSNRM